MITKCLFVIRVLRFEIILQKHRNDLVEISVRGKTHGLAAWGYKRVGLSVDDILDERVVLEGHEGSRGIATCSR